MEQTPLQQKQWRAFGLIVGGVGVLLGLKPLLRPEARPHLWLLGAGALLVLLGVLVPQSLRPAYRGWMVLGAILGWINTRIILSVIFYGVFTPIGLCMRLRQRDPMQRVLQPEATTYRTPRQGRDADHMTRQF